MPRFALLAATLAGVDATLKAGAFTKYFNYAGTLAVSGTVDTVTTTGTTQTFAYSLSGVDPLCVSGAGTAANSCGIHIHSEKTCTANAGGHYFTGAVTADPWTTVAYTSTGGYTSGSVAINTGATEAEVIGRSLIIHGFDGGRIGCAILEGKCEGWCDTYHFASPDCSHCATTTAYNDGSVCLGWCNADTCDRTSDKYCEGCTWCDAAGKAARCESWCNIYTCESNPVQCVGCDGTGSQPPCHALTTICANWCNKWTKTDKFCLGCP